ncbi:MAG TPA: hypothetical protein VF702_07455 [Allosphingosinicella sp.]|jgi:hypothetical protein
MQNPNPPERLVAEVRDEQTFVGFLLALADDFALEEELHERHGCPPGGPGLMGWQNGSIDAFLERAASASGGDIAHGKDVNPWKKCAMILIEGKHRE